MKIYLCSSNRRPRLTPAEEIEVPLIFGKEPSHPEVIIPVIGTGSRVKVFQTNSGIVLVRNSEDDPDDRCLLLFYFSDVSNFEYEITPEKFRILVNTPRGDKIYNILAIVSPGAVFKIERNWYEWNGIEWIVENTGERNARMTLEKYERGDGVWL